MALPSKTDVSQLTFSLDGGPWCRATAKDTIDVNVLNYSRDGSPWATACIASLPPAVSFIAYYGSLRITKIYHASTPITALHLTPP